MRNFKGIELPVNSVIVIALAIFVLLMLAMFFGNSSDELSSIDAQTAYTKGCSTLASAYNCDADAVTQIKTTLTEGGDNVDLLTACRNYYNDPSMSAADCAASCSGCKSSGMTVFAGDVCAGTAECQASSYTSDWECLVSCEEDSTKYCCPKGQTWSTDKSACVTDCPTDETEDKEETTE